MYSYYMIGSFNLLTIDSDAYYGLWTMRPVLIPRKSVNGAACDFVANLFIVLREDILKRNVFVVIARCEPHSLIVYWYDFCCNEIKSWEVPSIRMIRIERLLLTLYSQMSGLIDIRQLMVSQTLWSFESHINWSYQKSRCFVRCESKVSINLDSVFP